MVINYLQYVYLDTFEVFQVVIAIRIMLNAVKKCNQHFLLGMYKLHSILLALAYHFKLVLVGRYNKAWIHVSLVSGCISETFPCHILFSDKHKVEIWFSFDCHSVNFVSDLPRQLVFIYLEDVHSTTLAIRQESDMGGLTFHLTFKNPFCQQDQQSCWILRWTGTPTS